MSVEEVDLFQDDIYEELLSTSNSDENGYITTFAKGLSCILESKKHFSKVKIFAYDAKNYISQIEQARIKIDSLILLLKRASDYQAWFMHNDVPIRKYREQLENIVNRIKKLKDGGYIKNVNVRFYDFESYNHFGIFDGKLITGFLIPTLSVNDAPVKIEEVFVSLTVHALTVNCNRFFDKIFGSNDKLDGIAVVDSGLLMSENECEMCEMTKATRDDTIVEIEKCNLPLTDSEPNFRYITIRPDFHPISDIHLLLFCKYHMLSLYELIRHEKSIDELELLISNIAKVVKREYKRDILLFEHGSKMCNSLESGNSIEHLHLHIILKPNEFNYLEKIVSDNKRIDEPIVKTTDKPHKFNSLRELNNNPLLRNKDYFLILEPLNIDPFKYEIYVMFPQKKESQYLRRIFYSALTIKEKTKLYGANLKYSDDDDYYDWKKHEGEIKYSDERLEEHRHLGDLIFNEYRAK